MKIRKSRNEDKNIKSNNYTIPFELSCKEKPVNYSNIHTKKQRIGVALLQIQDNNNNIDSTVSDILQFRELADHYIYSHNKKYPVN